MRGPASHPARNIQRHRRKDWVATFPKKTRQRKETKTDTKTRATSSCLILDGILAREMSSRKKPPAPDNLAGKPVTPAPEKPVGKFKKWANEWAGVFGLVAAIAAVLGVVGFYADFYVKVGVLQSDGKRNSQDIAGLS